MTDSRPTLAPAAVLFDLGGGLFRSPVDRDGYRVVAGHVADLVARSCGQVFTTQEVTERIEHAARTWSRWKDASSAHPEPPEYRWEQFWDAVSEPWTHAPRAVVRVHAQDLCRRFEQATLARRPIDGMRDVLELLAGHGVRTGILSNALAGSVSREVVASSGFEPLLGVQLYSDEQGLRKPNPVFLRRACEALDVAPERTWLIGDTLDRDVRCARRAGATAVLLPGQQPPDDPHHPDQPDLVVTSGQAFRAVLIDVLERVPRSV